MSFFADSKLLDEGFPHVFTKTICNQIFERPDDAWFHWEKTCDYSGSALVRTLCIKDSQALVRWIVQNSSLILSHTSVTELDEKQAQKLSHLFTHQNLSTFLDSKWRDIAMKLWVQGGNSVSYVIKNANYRIACPLRLMLEYTYYSNRKKE